MLHFLWNLKLHGLAQFSLEVIDNNGMACHWYLRPRNDFAVMDTILLIADAIPDPLLICSLSWEALGLSM